MEITIEADPQKARSVLGLIGQETPRDLAGFVKEGVEQIPGACGLDLGLTIALALYFSRNFRGIIPGVRPDNLRRNIEVQRLRLEEVTEGLCQSNGRSSARGATRPPSSDIQAARARHSANVAKRLCL